MQEKRSYAEVLRRSRYQDEADIGAGTREEKGAEGQVQVQEDARGPGQDGAGGQEQEGAREDIQARLRRAQYKIVTDTWANRAQRTRQPRDFIQAGTKEREKRPGRGRRDG